MTNYRSGEIVLVRFPFSGDAQGKQRPALVIADTGDRDVLVARITTQQARTALDMAIAGWKDAGLLAPCCVRADKLATVEKQLVIRKLGVISQTDRVSIGVALRQLLKDW
jgi:mRNA interferase MazF